MDYREDARVRAAGRAVRSGWNRAFSFLQRLRLRDKLLFGIGSGVLLTLTVSLQNIYALDSVRRTVVQTNEMDLLAVSHLQNSQRDAYAMGRQVRLMAMAPGSAEREAARKLLAQARTQVESDLPAARARIFRAEAIRKLAEVESLAAGYGLLTSRAAGLILPEAFSGDNEASRFILGPEFRAAGAELDRALGALIQVQQEAASAGLAACARTATATERLTIAILAAGMLASVAFGLLLITHIRRPLEDLRHCIEALALGRLDGAVPHTELPNEMGAMARAVRVLQMGSQAQETERWIKQGMLEIDQAVAQANNIQTFAEALASSLARTLELVYLDVYLSDGAALRRRGGYALADGLERSFAFGEGPIGQAALDQRSLTLGLPEDTELGTRTGLGQVTVRYLHLAPICDRGQTLAVLEMGSRTGFQARHRAFLELLLPAVAIKLRILGGAGAVPPEREAAHAGHADHA